MTFKVGGNTFSFMWTHPALQAMDELGALGLSTFDVIVTPGHLWPSEIARGGRTQLKQDLAGRGFTLDSLNPPATDYNLASLTPNVRQLALDMYVEIIELAADLEAKAVVVVPGRVSSLLPPPRYKLDTVIEDSISQLALRAAVLGVGLHLEVHPLTPMPMTRDLLTFVQKLASPAVGIAYDVANAEFVGEDQASAIAAMGKHLTQIHLSDATRTRWMHGSFGTGTVDLRSVLNALDAIGYSGSAVFEIISDAPLTDYRDSIERLNAARAAP